MYVQPINFPTVPRGSEQLGFTQGPAHTEAMTIALADAMAENWTLRQIDAQHAA